MSRLVEGLGILGGSAGLVYGVGYLILAGHYRALGLSVRSTDTPSLLANSWEFLVQGTLFSVIRALQAASDPRVLLLGTIAVICFIAAFWWRRNTWTAEVWGRRLESAFRRQPGRLVGALGVVLLTTQLYQISAHVIPASAVTSLLFVPEPAVPPFPALRPLWLAYFDHHYEEVRRAIVGDGVKSDFGVLSRLYMNHVLVAVTTFAIAFVLWRFVRRMQHGRGSRFIATTTLVLGVFLLFYTPLYYGITMKSYRYPKVRFSGAVSTANETVLSEFRASIERPRFLVQTTEEEFILYEVQFREIHVIKRDLVAIMKIMATDEFLFGDINPRE